MNLTQKILIGMGLGLALGVVFQATDLVSNDFIGVYVLDGAIDAGGKIFVTLLKMMVVPLVFVSLICGATSLGATGSVGRLGGKTIGLYLATTALAVSLALILALVVDPGLSAADEQNGAVAFDAYQAKDAPSVKDTLINIFPSNPIQAMADGKMLQVIVFALLLGLALSRAGDAGSRIAGFFQDLNEVMMKLITMVIQLTPYGVFCLMVKLGATVGWVEIGKVLAYFLTVASALILHGLLVYPTLLRILAGVNPSTFLRKMREPMLVAFSTSSSGATLPVTLRTVEHRIGVNNNVASFAVPLGATINMDGTALFECVVVVFLAQLFGVEMGFVTQFTVVLMALLTSIGVAGIPSASLVAIIVILQAVGFPPESIAIGVGIVYVVDRILDMTRTAINVFGDSCAAVIIGKSEGESGYYESLSQDK